MGQILTKYLSGPLGVSEAADALLDPRSAFRFFLDFINDKEDDEYVSTDIAGSSTAVVTAGQGGLVVINTVGTSAGNGGTVSSPDDFIVLDGGRTVYIEARLKISATAACWYFGLTADSPAGSEWSTASITPSAAAVLIGLDAGTDSLTGAGSAGRQLQLSLYGTSHVETLLPLTVTLAADTFYRVGLVVKGWKVQAYLDGKKIGPETSLNSNVTTTMGVQLSCVTAGTTARTLTCDYLDCVATR